MNEATCVHCGKNSDQAPLIAIQYQQEQFWICPQHLPILIHKPAQLAGKLPGAENLGAPEERHH
jgi:hypothetical protein